MYLRIPLYWAFVTFVFLAVVRLEHLPLSAVYSPTVLIVFGPIPLLLVSRLGLGGALQFGFRLVRGQHTKEDSGLASLIISSAFLFGALGIVLGNIHVMRNLAHPDAIGPGIAWSFVSLVYAILVPIYLLPFLDIKGVKALARRSVILAVAVVPSLMGLTYFTFTVVKIPLL